MMKRNGLAIMKKSCIFSLIILFVLSSVTMVSTSEQTNEGILYIGGTGEGNFTTISDALTEADSGDILFVYEGIYNENIIIDKSIQLIGQNSLNTMIVGNGTDNVISIFASNVVLKKVTVKNSGVAVYDQPQNDSSQAGDNDDQGVIVPMNTENILLTIPVNFSGIYVEADDVNISSCMSIDCHSGIFIRNTSDCTVFNCSFINNSQCGYVVNAKHIEVYGCQISTNGIGLYFIQSVQCLLSENEFVSNINALMFSATDSSLVHHNYFELNDISIILIDNCFENIFYQNTFINSVVQHVIDNCNNSWDNGLVGNYWDDYEGNDADGDGIGDSSYFIPQISYDQFPLMGPVSESSMLRIIISSLSQNEKISGDFLLKGSIVGGGEVQSVRIKIDTGSWMVAEGTNSWQYTIDTVEFEDGDHELFVSAIDALDQSTVKTMQFQIDNGNQSGDIDKSEDTPGFVFVMMISGVLIMVLIRKRGS